MTHSITVPVPLSLQRLQAAEDHEVLQRLLNGSPEEAEAWIRTNLTTVEKGQDVVIALVLAIRWLYHESKKAHG